MALALARARPVEGRQVRPAQSLMGVRDISRWSLGSESGVGTRGRVAAKEPAPSVESGLQGHLSDSYLCPEQGVLGPGPRGVSGPVEPLVETSISPATACHLCAGHRCETAQQRRCTEAKHLKWGHPGREGRNQT